MNRIHALDGLRGVAALAVVVYHLTQVRLGLNLFPHGYLAVDFFFILSGLVVAKAYEQRLREEMTFKRFLAIRAVRLMPLSILGALAGLLVLLAKWAWYPDKVDQLWQIVVSGVLNFVLLPTPFGGAASRQELFPGNGPLWSLFFEVVANAVWATLFVRLAVTHVIAILGIGSACFAAAVLYLGGANFGWDVGTAWFGLLRVLVGFLIGVLLHRYLPARPVTRSRFAAYGVATALTAVLAMPVWSGIYDVACVLLVFPAVVAYAATNHVAEPTEQRLWALLGDLSYPLYVLHFPILLVASGASQALGGKAAPSVFALGALATSIVAAWVAFRVYDEPVRAKLGTFVRRGLQKSSEKTPAPVPTHGPATVADAE